MKNVLVLCTGNSARSILGEVLFNALGHGRLKAFSAGSNPKGAVHPQSLKLLSEKGYDTGLLRSKSWDEFMLEGAPKLDIVITVCDSAAEESCPLWIGAPVQSHWGIADPAAVEGEGQREAFELAYERMKARIQDLLSVDFENLTLPELKMTLDAIGATSEGATATAQKSVPATV